MSLLNKHKNIVVLAVLAASVLLTAALPAQNRRSRQNRIPDEVLEHRMITERELANHISDLQVWLSGKYSADPGKISDTIEVKRKNEEGATVTEKREVKLTYQDFRKHASGISAMLTEPLIFDVMEVSAIRKDWFEAVNKACDALSGNLKRMDHARMRWSLKVYAAEYAKFAENRKRCMELLSRRKQFEFGQKSDAMKKLKQDNRIRRAKAYRAALLQRQQEKAEGKNKPGGKK